MKDTLAYILQNITMHPEDVKVEEQSDPTGIKHLVVTTNPEDVGRVIGKEGKVIKAIRTIMRVAAIIKGDRVRVTVISETTEGQEVAASETVEPVAATEETQEAPAPEKVEETTPEAEESESSEEKKSEDSLQVEIE